MRDVWKDMWEIYRKMGLSEEEIAKRMLCKTAKVIGGRKGLDECDEKEP